MQPARVSLSKPGPVLRPAAPVADPVPVQPSDPEGERLRLYEVCIGAARSVRQEWGTGWTARFKLGAANACPDVCAYVGAPLPFFLQAFNDLQALAKKFDRPFAAPGEQQGHHRGQEGADRHARLTTCRALPSCLQLSSSLATRQMASQLWLKPWLVSSSTPWAEAPQRAGLWSYRCSTTQRARSRLAT